MFSSVQKVSLSNKILIGETLERIPSSFMLCCSVMVGSGDGVGVACLLTETVVPGLILDVDLNKFSLHKDLPLQFLPQLPWTFL